jgi:hypothetical protein
VGGGSGEQGKVAAADGADTTRAESETKVEESPADAEGGKGSTPEADGKGGAQ